MTWPRPTAWRQGNIFLSEKFTVLGLTEFDGFEIAIAISHSCDIANTNLDLEPDVEFIVGRIASRDGNLLNAKNPRILHLIALNNGTSITLELSAKNKITIPKKLLTNHEPDVHHVIEDKQLNILQDWLAARYKRHALPDNFNERFAPISTLLQRIGRQNATGILGYYLDYQPRNEELTEPLPYEIWLYLVYSTDDPKYEKEAMEISRAITDKFSHEIKKSEHLGPIELVECNAYSETEFTVSDTRDNILIRFDHLSHRIDPTGPTL